jgi:hypothetical protein
VVCRRLAPSVAGRFLELAIEIGQQPGWHCPHYERQPDENERDNECRTA